jgi:CTP:molybdopterin cytidylyltransferase MocA
VKEEDVAEFIRPAASQPQRFLEVTSPVVARSMAFSFAEDFRGLEVIEKAGTVIAHDGDTPIVTPHDHCVLVQPSLRHLGVGVTVVRLAKILDVNPRQLSF